MKKKNRMILTLLVLILAITGCGNAVNIGDSQGQKKNADETVKAAADLSEGIQQESTVPDLPEEGELPENIKSLSEDAVSDAESKEIAAFGEESIDTAASGKEDIDTAASGKEDMDTAASGKEDMDTAASDTESKDTDRAALSKEDVSGMKEDVTNETTGLETSLGAHPIYEIANGNTGERITLNDSQQLEYMNTLLENMTFQKEESIQSDAEKTVGYLYCIRVLNENGDVSKTITLNGSHVKIDGEYYIVESTEDLATYLDDLYK